MNYSVWCTLSEWLSELRTMALAVELLLNVLRFR